MRRGLSCIVPLSHLSLFTPTELELMVCGRSKLDVDRLEKRANYRGVSRLDRHIVFFWRALRAFTAAQQRMFVRFVSVCRCVGKCVQMDVCVCVYVCIWVFMFVYICIYICVCAEHST